jgi:hypothetical protein
VNGFRSIARFVAVAARAWAVAAVALLGIKQQRLRVRRELHSQLTPLGEAVHRGDQARVEQLKTQAEQLEQQLTTIDRNGSTVVEHARETVEREKASSQATQALPSIKDERESGGRHGHRSPDEQPVPARPTRSTVERRRRRAPLAR